MSILILPPKANFKTNIQHFDKMPLLWRDIQHLTQLHIAHPSTQPQDRGNCS